MIGLNHNGEPAEKNSLESGGCNLDACARATLAAAAAAAVWYRDLKYDIDVIMNRSSIGHITQPSFIGEHIMLAVVVVDDRFSEINLVAIFST